MADGPLPGVLIVDLARGEGGAERRVLQLAQLLPAVGVPVRVACLAGAPLHRSLVRAGVLHTPLARSRLDPRIRARLKSLLREHPGWVVDAHNAQSQLWSQLSRERSGRRLVATVHSEYNLSESRHGGVSLHERALRTASRRDWSFIAISTSVEEYLRRLGVATDRIWTVWSAVEAVATPPTDTRDAVRDSLGVPRDAFVVLSAGRLVPVKNLALLLHGIARLRREVRQTHLVVAGEGPERSRLQRTAEHLGLGDAVSFLGHRNDVPALMRASDACAMTSTIEGLPYTLLEAAAAGTPIVSTRVGAIGSVFTDQQSALLLDHPGEEQIAAALARLARAPSWAAELAARARDVVRTRLSPEAMVEGTIDAYAGTARSRRDSVSNQSVGSVPAAETRNGK